METKSIDFINQGFRKEILGFDGNVHWFHVNSARESRKLSRLAFYIKLLLLLFRPNCFF